MKVIKCNTPNGQFYIPLLPVAEHRANYYVCEKRKKERGGKEWEEEVNYVLEDDYEGIDWLINNTDWDEWEDIAVKINEKVKVTDDDFWCSSDDFTILDINE